EDVAGVVGVAGDQIGGVARERDITAIGADRWAVRGAGAAVGGEERDRNGLQGRQGSVFEGFQPGPELRSPADARAGTDGGVLLPETNEGLPAETEHRPLSL